MQHLAVIMDGNGRWAERRGQERSYGYRFGAEALMKLLADFLTLPISVMTVYAFSTENNNRNNKEVSNIFSVIASFLLSGVFPFCEKYNVKIRFIGDINGLPERMQRVLGLAPKKNGEKTIVIALNYGGTNEVTRAFVRLREKGVENPTEKDLLSCLDTTGLPLPDVVLRYGGYKRLSNFLPIQSAYSELFFTEKLWPDYAREDIEKVLTEYSSIKRNFGGNHA